LEVLFGLATDKYFTLSANDEFVFLSMTVKFFSVLELCGLSEREGVWFGKVYFSNVCRGGEKASLSEK
jgi:hypothetical protein